MDQPYKLKRPKDLDEYIITKLASKTYLIFDRKKDICRCTRCGAVRQISKMNDSVYLKHNEEHWCYDCGEKAIGKEAHYGRKGITEYGRILWTAKRGRTTFAQLDEYDLSFQGDSVTVDYWQSAQYKFTTDEQLYYKHYPEGCWSPDAWIKHEDVKLPRASKRMFSSYWHYAKYEHTFLYPYIKRGTDLKYADLLLPENYTQGAAPYALIAYFYLFLKWQSIELLWKAGYNQIVLDRIDGETTSYINWRSKELRKILKLNNKELRDFKLFTNGRIVDLIKYKDLQKIGHDIDFKYLDVVTNYKPEKQLKEINEFVRYKKALKYVSTQECDLSIYIDYLNDCNYLGKDMDNKNVLMPKNLIDAHEQSNKERITMKEAILAEGFEEQQKKITGMEKPFVYGDYLIRPAASPKELADEGQVLHHCVRNYANKVADGRCAILFIRKVSDQNQPLYTLELSPKKTVVQCRGLHNCSYSDDVNDFINAWLADIKKPKKKATKTGCEMGKQSKQVA